MLLYSAIGEAVPHVFKRKFAFHSRSGNLEKKTGRGVPLYYRMRARRKRGGRLALLLVLCLLAGFSSAESLLDSEKNVCGGRRPLHAQLWGRCDLGLGPVTDESGAVAHGHVQCEGMEAIWCAPYFESEDECPVCALNRITQEREEAQRRVDVCRMYCSLEGGVCAHDGMCHCHAGRTGVWCEGSDCGEHGRYSPDRGACVCESEWHGRYCEVHVEAAAAPAPIIVQASPSGPVEYRNGWAAEEGGKIECHEGFAGDGCTMCAAEAVCVPTHDVENPYTLALIHPSQQSEELFDPEPALTTMYYGKKPFRPNMSGDEYSCDCRPREALPNSKLGANHHHTGVGQSLSKQSYMHDHYDYHYVPRGTVKHFMAGAALIIIFITFLLVLFVYKYSPSKHRKARMNGRRQQQYPQQQQYAPASPLQQQQPSIFGRNYLNDNFDAFAEQ